MKSELHFYEGVRSSGVVASITYGKSRVIFDFGAPFNPMTQPYDGAVEPRKKAWVRDAIRLGQIPAVGGVFSKEDLGEGSDIVPFEESDLETGVIISHLHLDHMSGIGMIHPDIPVYMHRDGHRLQQLLDDIGEAVGEREFTPVALYEPFNIGEIEVAAYFSDHPCAGAVGFLIKTPDGNFFYSGDVRLHGNKRDKALQDLEKIAQEDVDVLIMETTTLAREMPDPSDPALAGPNLQIPKGMSTEEELYEQILESLGGSRELALFNIYHRDIELIKRLFDIAAATKREIVFEPKTAYVVMGMLGVSPSITIPDNEEYADRNLPYLRKVLDSTPRIVTAEEINAQPARYFVQNSYENILELFDLPVSGAKYYHLYGVPLVQGARDYDNMMRVLELLGVDYALFSNLYCYNHAYPNHLLYMAEKIGAKNLIGVHSSAPEKLVAQNSRQVVAQNGDTYLLDDGKLLKKEALLRPLPQ